MNKICKNIFKCLIALVAALFISGAAYSPVNASAASYSNQMFEADGTEASVVEEKADGEEAEYNDSYDLFRRRSYNHNCSCYICSIINSIFSSKRCRR